jgi:Leucine Rich repeat
VRLTIFQRWKRWQGTPWFPYVLFSLLLFVGGIWQAYEYWWGVEIDRWLDDGAGSANRIAVFPTSWKGKIGPSYLEPFEPITHVTLTGGRSSQITFSNGTTAKIVRAFPISADNVRKIRRLPFLKSLYVGSELEPEAWEAVGQLRQLKSLSLPSIGKLRLNQLWKMNRLEELSMRMDRSIPVSEIRVVNALQRLRRLRLRFGGRMTMDSDQDDGSTIEQQMKELAKSRTLTRIEATIPDDSMLIALTDQLSNGDFPLIKVNELRLSGSNISNQALINLHNVPNLIHLDLSKTKIDDDGLDNLKSIPTLRTLYLAGCDGISDNAAEDLSELTGLESLNVANTNLTQAGLLKLGTLKRLRMLRISYHLNVSPELRQCFPPGCQIERR